MSLSDEMADGIRRREKAEKLQDELDKRKKAREQVDNSIKTRQRFDNYFYPKIKEGIEEILNWHKQKGFEDEAVFFHDGKAMIRLGGYMSLQIDGNNVALYFYGRSCGDDTYDSKLINFSEILNFGNLLPYENHVPLYTFKRTGCGLYGDDKSWTESFSLDYLLEIIQNELTRLKTK